MARDDSWVENFDSLVRILLRKETQFDSKATIYSYLFSKDHDQHPITMI